MRMGARFAAARPPTSLPSRTSPPLWRAARRFGECEMTAARQPNARFGAPTPTDVRIVGMGWPSIRLRVVRPC